MRGLLRGLGPQKGIVVCLAVLLIGAVGVAGGVVVALPGSFADHPSRALVGLAVPVVMVTMVPLLFWAHGIPGIWLGAATFLLASACGRLFS